MPAPAAPLRLALLGHGRMGRLVGALAPGAGHAVAATFTSGTPVTAGTLAGADVAVDFSHADAVVANARACAEAGIPLVVGTTGWAERLGEVTRVVEAGGGALVYGANFSVGVHVFYRTAAHAAALFARAGGYAPFLEERHHAAKRDAPSGTALELQRLVADAYGELLPDAFPIAATRAGYIPGTHRVGFDGLPDTVVLEHVARSRDGFAHGALVAAAWITGQARAGRTGVFRFEEVMDDVLGGG